MQTLFFCLFCFFSCHGSLFLKENLRFATQGDFIVTQQGKTYTVMLICDKQGNLLTVEEISSPKKQPWRDYITQGAPGNSCWVRYVIDTNTGKMQQYFSFTQRKWCDMAQANTFLTTLLNLNFTAVPANERKRRGSNPLGTDFWQPQMIVDGKPVPNVPFEPFKTLWPHDGSELGGKEILIYIPQESEKYPSYFPYWLQISGMVEKAKIRIVDSGRHLTR